MNRKLRPIYDALDARNYKLSLKLCTAALQKTDAPLIKALKAVTLERLGRPEDALTLCREVKDNLRPPADDQLLNTLMMVFKATGCTDEGTSCLERAYEQEADNEELAHFLFGNYLRAQEHQKAQQLSMRMHKQFSAGTQRYVYWAVTCMLLQTPAEPPSEFCGEGGEGGEAAEATPTATKQLALAAAMLKRVSEQGKLRNEAELRLYLEVLVRQAKYQGPEVASVQVALLESHGKIMCAAEERLSLQASLHETLGKWREARLLWSELLSQHAADDWEAHQGLVRCVLEEERSAEGKGSEARAEVAVPAARAVAEAPRGKHLRLRGPWLAELDLEAGLVKHDPARGGGALRTALAAYFGRFSSKPSCFLDAAPYLAALAALGPAEPGALFAEPQLARAHALPPPAPPSLEWVRAFISACEWRLGLGCEAAAPAELRWEMARQWLQTYDHHRPLSADLDVREFGHADRLALLAAELCVGCPASEWSCRQLGEGDNQLPLGGLLRAVLGLQLASSASPHNFQLSLALMQGLLCMGAVEGALQLYNRCAVKHVQLETLTFVALPAMAQVGGAAQAAGPMAAAARFRRDGMQDMQEAVGLAFRSDNYVQAAEMAAPGPNPNPHPHPHPNPHPNPNLKPDPNPDSDQAAEMATFQHSIERSWWRRLLETLELLPRLAADAANAASLRATLAQAAVLDTDVTPAALAALPRLLDLNVFETRLPPGMRGGGLRLLRLAWLPRRVLLLRLLRHALAGEADEMAAAESALGKACAAATAATAAAATATPGGAPGGGKAAAAAAAAAGAGAGACLGGEADEPWVALLAMSRVAVLLSQLLAITDGGAAAEAEPPATQQAKLRAELLSQVEAYSCALVAQCTALHEALGAAGGFAPAPLRAATHLLSLQLPCLCVLQQRWAQQLPAQPKRKKKGEDKAGEDKAGEDKAEQEAPPQPAEPADLRGALRAASARVAASLAELQEGVGTPEPMVCAVLREAPLREHLGGSEAAQQAHQHVLDALLAAGKTSVATLGAALKHAIAALRQTSKQL